MAIARHFVDREKELRLFEQMLAPSSRAGCLLILEEPGRGKTSLLWRIMETCQEKYSVPVALLDFDPARGRLIDYRGVGRCLCDELGRDDFPRYCKLDEQIHIPSPQVVIGGGQGGGAYIGRDIGTGGGDFAGRDQIQTGDIIVTESRAAGAHRENWVRDALGAALRDDLAAAANKHKRVVILLDTFEQVPEETRQWLLNWLFKQLPKLPYLLLVVAGRPDLICIEFFEHTGPWSSRIERLDTLSPFGDDHILHYFRECWQLAVEWEQIMGLSEVFRYNPDFMTKAAVLLKQQRVAQ